MKKIKKSALFLLLVTVIAVFSSCFDYEEMNKLILLTAIAVDKDENGYELSMQILTSKGNDENVETVTTVKSEKGETMAEAVTKIQYYYAEPLYFEHLETVIISKEIAKKSFEEFIGFIGEMGQYYDFDVIVSEDCMAKDILTSGSFSNHISIVDLTEIIEKNTVAAVAPTVKGYDILTYNGDIIIPVVRLTEKENVSEEERVDESKIVLATGGAVITSGKYRFTMSADECRDYNFSTSKIKNSLLEIESGKTVTVLSCKSNVTARFNGRPQITVTENIYFDGNITDKEKAEEYLEKSLEKTLNKLYREYNCDCYGIYEKLKAFEDGFDMTKNEFRQHLNKTETEVKVNISVASEKNLTEQ